MVSPKRRLELFDPFKGIFEPEIEEKPKQLEFSESTIQETPEDLETRQELGESVSTGLRRIGPPLIAGGQIAVRGASRVVSPVGRFVGEKTTALTKKELAKLTEPIKRARERAKLKAQERMEESELKRLESQVVKEKGRLITQEDVLEQQQFRQAAIQKNIEAQQQLIEERLGAAKSPEIRDELLQKQKQLSRFSLGRTLRPEIIKLQLERLRKKQQDLARKEQEVALRKSLLAGRKAIVIPERIKTGETARAGRIVQLSQEISTLETAKSSLLQQLPIASTTLQRLAIQNRINTLNTRIGLRQAELNRLR